MVRASKDFVNGYGRTIALARVARQGRPPKSNVDTTRGSTRVFRKPASFLRLRLFRGRAGASCGDETDVPPTAKIMDPEDLREITIGAGEVPRLLAAGSCHS